MSVIQEDCCFYAAGEEDQPFEEKRIRAMCMECYGKLGYPKGLWNWPGKTQGYGDYDLRCSMDGCDNIIHQRSDEYDDSKN